MLVYVVALKPSIASRRIIYFVSVNFLQKVKKSEDIPIMWASSVNTLITHRSTHSLCINDQHICHYIFDSWQHNWDALPSRSSHPPFLSLSPCHLSFQKGQPPWWVCVRSVWPPGSLSWPLPQCWSPLGGAGTQEKSSVQWIRCIEWTVDM